MGLPRIACATAGLALVLLGAAGPVYRLGIPLDAAFALFRWAAYAGIVSAALCTGVAFWTYRRGRKVDTGIAVAGLAIALTAVGIPLSWAWAASAAPVIHDISTDLQNPPAFASIVPLRADAANDLERTPQETDLQRQGYPNVQPLTVSLPPAQAFDRALQVGQQMGWEIVSADKSSGLIEATATTQWFRFKDDVVVRLTEWGAGTRVDVRSVSRIGRSDVGTNARRIGAFLSRMATP